jgi:hypothetical protein
MEMEEFGQHAEEAAVKKNQRQQLKELKSGLRVLL